MATVEKRGNSWRLIVFVGRAAGGKQLKKSKTIPAEGVTKKEAQRLANEFETETLKKSYIDDKNYTLAQFIDFWKKEYALQEGVYSPTTLERNEYLLNRIIPALGSIRLKKLKPTHLMQFYNNLREPGMRMDRDKEGKLSSRSVQMHHKFLAALLNKAKKWQYLEVNPCDHVDAPKSKSKQAPIYDEETLIKFLTLLHQQARTKYLLFFLIGFSTGLRRGEILGLRWQDINFEESKLRVNQSAIVVKGEGIKYKDPKTDKSANGVSVSLSVFEVLNKHRAEQNLLKERVGTSWPDNDLIFTTIQGKPMFPSTVSHWLKGFIEEHGLPHISPHSFRHMSVTYAIDRGFDLKAISERARHTMLSTTIDGYGHVLPQKDQAIAASLDEIIKQVKKEKPDYFGDFI